MSSRPKVISYGQRYVPVMGISDHNERRKIIKVLKVFVVISTIITLLAYFKLYLIHDAQISKPGTKVVIHHSNPCRHVTPEPVIIMQEKFDSNDYFFPQSYNERVCATPNKTENKENEGDEIQKCLTDSDKAEGNIV
ncbi:uncharacterized protein LOC114537260 [Dendronephthya gigantea]|uniref:uncharacterized protein LOC114537260 n=1 Tax=Dendronephthya gigantea TaxID=151771 RepID=UPI00106CD115|nr:uncharacterized protein LOC114537260 [Dendronephthya gigantea]